MKDPSVAYKTSDAEGRRTNDGRTDSRQTDRRQSDGWEREGRVFFALGPHRSPESVRLSLSLSKHWTFYTRCTAVARDFVILVI